MALTSRLVSRLPPMTGLNQTVSRWLELFARQFNTLRVLHGTGSPLTVVVADRGALYLRDDGGAGTTLYIKEGNDGTANGWRAV